MINNLTLLEELGRGATNTAFLGRAADKEYAVLLSYMEQSDLGSHLYQILPIHFPKVYEQGSAEIPIHLLERSPQLPVSLSASSKEEKQVTFYSIIEIIPYSIWQLLRDKFEPSHILDFMLSVFKQLVYILDVTKLQHNDLHLDNIRFKPTTQKEINNIPLIADKLGQRYITVLIDFDVSTINTTNEEWFDLALFYTQVIIRLHITLPWFYPLSVFYSYHTLQIDVKQLPRPLSILRPYTLKDMKMFLLSPYTYTNEVIAPTLLLEEYFPIDLLRSQANLFAQHLQ